MTEPTADDLARWAALVEQATPGPWTRTHRGIEAGYDDVIVPGHVECMAYCYGGASTIEGDRLETDAEFITAARTAVPRLLALVAAQADQIAELQRRIEAARDAGEQIEQDYYGASAADVYAALDGTESTP